MTMAFILGLISLFFASDDDIRAKIDSVNGLGNEYLYSNISDAIPVFRQNLLDAEVVGYPAGQAKTLQQLGLVLYLNGEYDESLAAYLDAIRKYEELGDQESMAKIYGEMGYQMKRRDLEKATDLMQKGIFLAEKISFDLELPSLYNNYGVLKEMSAELDSAGYYYQLGLDILVARQDSAGIPFSLNNLANLAMQEKDYAEAARLLAESDLYREKEEGTYGRLMNAVSWADWYSQQNKLDEAAAQYEKVISLPGALEQKYLVFFCYTEIMKIYEVQHKFELAYQNQQQYTLYKDSIFSAESSDKIAALEIEFETEKKDHKLAENQLQFEKQSRQLLLLAFIALIFLVTGVIVYIFQKHKRAQIKKNIEHEAEIRQSKLRQQITDEKLRISRDLHDNIGSQLTFLVSSVDNLTFKSDDDVIIEKLESISDFGRQTLYDLRNTVWAIKGEESTLEDLVLKLQEVRRRFSQNMDAIAFEITNSVEIPIQLSSIQALNLYRIAQECLQNAVKHAGATEIGITISIINDQLQLIVKDNGSGFDFNQSSLGNGLENMKRRCEETGGSFEIKSDQNGTQITCQMPIDLPESVIVG